jgi:hypothetical protein
MYPCKENLIELAELAKSKDFVSRDVTGDGNKETFCNFFVSDVAKGMGFDELQGMLANEMIDHIATHPEFICLDQEWLAAQTWADQGYLVIYGSKAKGHGHVCIGIPGRLTKSPKWKENLPSVANVGKSNFIGKHLGWAWSPEAGKNVKCWVWKGPKEEKMPVAEPKLTENLALNVPPIPLPTAGAKEGKSTTEFKIAWGSFLLGVGQIALGVASKLVPFLAPLAAVDLIGQGSEMAIGALGLYGGARVLSKGIADVTQAVAAKKK